MQADRNPLPLHQTTTRSSHLELWSFEVAPEAGLGTVDLGLEACWKLTRDRCEGDI